MRRRAFIAGLGSATTWPVVARGLLFLLVAYPPTNAAL